MQANLEWAGALLSGAKPLSKKRGRPKVLKSKEYIARYKAKKREENEKRYDEFKCANSKKEKWVTFIH